MADNKSEFKRRFPKVGKCCCCCNSENSVFTCTILIAVWLGIKTLPVCFSLKNISSKIELVLIICVIISLILLLFGTGRYIIPLMDQFKIVFLIYLIIQISSYIYTIYLVNKEEYFKNSTKVYKETYGKNNSYLSQQVEEKPDEFFEYSIKQTIYFNVIGNVIISAILIFYYLSTCSHIEDIEELIYKEKNARILENNE